MKITHFLFGLGLLANQLLSQNTNYNYQHTVLPLSGITSESALPNINPSLKMESVEYKDGLGRNIQIVNKKTSPAGNDQIQPVVYDNSGRQIKQYLPYTDPNVTSISGDYRPAAITAQQTFFTSTSKVASTNDAFSQTVFDNSPLDIAKEISAPGTNWNLSSGHTVKSEYRFNSPGEVLLWQPVSYGAQCNVVDDNPSYYPVGSLIVTKYIDPDGNYTRSFTDKFGNLIRIDQQYATVFGVDKFNTTCLVYDNMNQLTCIIPPKVYNAIVGFELDYNTYSWGDVIFQYEYDARGRVSRQRKPDCGWTSYVYNTLNQLILSQDEKQRTAGQWTFSKYDVFERPIVNGLFDANSIYGATNSHLQSYMQNVVDGLSSPLFENRTATNYSTQFGFTNQSFPISYIDIHMVNYYDDYDFNNDGTADYTLDVTALPGLTAPGEIVTPPAQTPSATTQTKGLLTGCRVKVLETSPVVPWLISAAFYDEKERLTQTQTNNYAGGTDKVTMVYDFTGHVTNMQRTHTGLYSTSLNIMNRIDYDRVGRVSQVIQKVNSDPSVILSQNKYNEIEQLVEKNIHSINGTSYLQSMDYTYNEQGWLTHMNNADLNVGTGNNNDDSNDMFGYELKYNTSTVNNANAPVSHSGRITEVVWKSISDAYKKSYACQYDKASRMLAAYYSEYNSGAGNWTNNVDKFSEYGITYDPNGNMTTLKRKGYATNTTNQLIDNLSFNLNGNKITTVADVATIQGYNDFQPTANSYVYDVNGNITFDPGKSLTITYNHLNLPQSISGPLGTILFTYDADGNRLKKKWTPTSGSIITNYYVNGVVYNSTALEYFGTSEGRLVPDGTLGWQYRYEYSYKDHLGNTRIAYSDLNADGALAATEVIQECHYYAFGLDMYGLGKTQIGPTNKLKFGEKEYIDENGANFYDFGARYYSPVIGRFLNADPHAENAPNQGSFNYALNNPFNFNDPTGMDAEDDDMMNFSVDGGPGDKDKPASKEQMAKTDASVTDLNKNCPGCYVNQNGVAVMNPNAPSTNNPAIQKTAPATIPTTTKSGDNNIKQSGSGISAKQMDAFYSYGGDGSGSFSDNAMYVLDKVRIFSPLTQAADALSIWWGGTDGRGIPKNNIDGAYSVMAGIPLVTIENLIVQKLVPWSSRSLNFASKSLTGGSKSVWVKSQNEAEELFLGHFQGYGLKNATGMSSTEAKNFFGSNFYHWDTKFGKDGFLLFHSPLNLHSTIPHLQVHMNGKIIRVFWIR